MDRLQGIITIVSPEVFNPVIDAYDKEFRKFPASVKHHHCESGGYLRHVYEVLTLCRGMNDKLCDSKSLMKVAFLHDLDKLERYEIDPEMPTKRQVDYARSLGIILDPKDSKSSVGTKIDNKKNGTNKPVQYYRYKEKLAADESAMVVRMCMELGIPLTHEEVHAISCHHGGWSALGQKGVKMSPMATILHCADLISANILGVHHGC